jgi:glycosyltransferase involved in cell wall biosynthesis
MNVMLTNDQKIKVLLYGNLSSRDYRSRLLVNFFLDSRYYCYSQVFPVFYSTKSKISFLGIQKISTILCWIEFSIKVAFADVVYLPPMNSKLIQSAIWTAKFFRKKLITEMYISLYDTHVRDRKTVEPHSKESRRYIQADKLALTQSDYIIHTTMTEIHYWEKILNVSVDRSKVFIAPVCNISSRVSRSSWKQNDVLRICWWGSFIPLHGLDNLFQALKILQQRKLKFTCNLFGVDNSAFPQYAKKLQSYQLDRTWLRKDLNFADGSLADYLVDNCDLALGIFGNTDKAYHAVPNKIVEALAMRIPTLTMNSPALDEFFNRKTDIWTCEPSPDSIAESILKIANGAAYPVDWEQTRRKVIDTFSVTRYQEVVKQAIEKATNSSLAEPIVVNDREQCQLEKLLPVKAN